MEFMKEAEKGLNSTMFRWNKDLIRKMKTVIEKMFKFHYVQMKQFKSYFSNINNIV